MGLKQPATSIKMTNVSIVKFKKAGHKFEIACYNNKVLEYRSKIEKDLDNVLQLSQVYSNVSKGQVSPQKELMAAFGTVELNVILLEILSKGELQVGPKERKLLQESLLKDIIEIISKKTINPTSMTPYTPSMIEKVLNELHFNPNTTKNAKQQALDAIHLIKSSNIIPIERVKMTLKLTCTRKVFDSLDLEKESVDSGKVKDVASVNLAKDLNEMDSNKVGSSGHEEKQESFTVHVDPERYKSIMASIGKDGQVHIIE